MLCHDCGKTSPTGAYVCVHCGTPRAVPAARTTVLAGPQSSATATAPTAPTPSEPDAGAPPQAPGPQPSLGPAASAAGDGPVRPLSNEFAWALALAPLVILFFNVTLLLTSPAAAEKTWLVPLVSFAVWIGLGLADVSRAKAAGYRLSGALAVLLAPVYLFVRAARTRTSYAIPLVGLVAIVATYFGLAMVPSVVGTPVDGRWTERAIERWWFEGPVPTGAGVHCPDGIVVGNGDTFTCSLETRRRSFLVEVTMQDAATSEIVWRLR